MMRFIDVFAGIVGVKIAFENAGFECVFSNDFDKNAAITFHHNFAEKMLLEDISNVRADAIPSHDIL